MKNLKNGGERYEKANRHNPSNHHHRHPRRDGDNVGCRGTGDDMSTTKRPKRAKVKRTIHTVKEIYSEYVCPACKITFNGFGPALNVTRFVCKCGQELIVDEVKNHG